MKLPIIFLNLTVIACILVVVTIDHSLVKYISASAAIVSLIVLLFFYQISIRKSSSQHNKITEDKINQDAVFELNQLLDLLENAVKEDLDIVKQELCQIKGLVNNAVVQLTDSFHHVSNNSDEQRRLIEVLLDTLNTVNNKQTLAKLDETHKIIKDSSAVAIQSLQFEDIVVQVSDNSIQYIDNLDKFLNEFRNRLTDRLKNCDQNTDSTENLADFVDAVEKIRQNRPHPDRKAAHQKNMSVGDVELF